MWSNADAVNVLVVDSDRVDLVTVEQLRHELVRSDAFDAHPADRAREPGIKRRMQLHSGNLARLCGPIVFQVEDALLLAFGADRLMKVNRFSNSLLDRKAPRPQCFKLADVVTVRISITGQRP